MQVTARGLNRATLARQLLLERQPIGTVDAVDRIVAIQAQAPASPYLALWARVVGFDPADLDRAFAEQAVVKAQLMRITLHAVTAADYPTFHEAMRPSLRAARLYDRRFTDEGVSIADTDALVPDLLSFTDEPRTSAEVEAWLASRFGAPKRRVWWALRHYGPFVHATTGGPWSFGPRPAYVSARAREPTNDEAASVRTLVRRYLEGFGPASVADIAQFGTIYRPPVQAALAAMTDELVRLEGPDGTVLYDVPDGARPPDETGAPPRLLPMWDSALLAHDGRRRLIPPELRRVVIRSNGDVLPTILVDGAVAGVWRAIDGGIEITTFQPLTDEARAGIEGEARSLISLLAGRDPRPFGRYDHWWSKLPAGEVRTLRG